MSQTQYVAAVNGNLPAGEVGLITRNEHVTSSHLRVKAAQLPDIARPANVHFAVGCEFDVDALHPDWLDTLGDSSIASFDIEELQDGIHGTNSRAALIGAIGTVSEITPRQRRVLAGAADAFLQTGAAINVHLDPSAIRALEVVDTLTAAGSAPERIVLSHMDLQPDHGVHREAAQIGDALTYDTFRAEFGWLAGAVYNYRDAHDMEKPRRVGWSLKRASACRLLLSETPRRLLTRAEVTA